jgi:hypothetical protein
MKRHRSEPPSAGTPADDQAEDTAMPNLARGLRELIDRASTGTPTDRQSGGAAMPNLARGVRELIDGASTGLLVPGTEEDKWAKEVMEANRKAEEADPEFKRRRQKRDADLQASYDRRLGVPLGVAKRQEKLIRDARTYAASYLLEAHSQVTQLRVTRLALRDLGITPNTEEFPLSFEALHAAIWTEGDPSLEELANKAGGNESADTRDAQLKQRLAAAMEVFERQPGHEKAQVWLSKRMEKVCKAAGPESSLPSGSSARATLVLKLFDVRAEAYLKLVVSIETQNAFVVMLDFFEIRAWEEFVGGYPTSVREGAPSIDQPIRERKRRWTRKGYERLEAHALDKRRSVGSKTSRVTAPVPMAEEIRAAEPSAPIAAGSGYTRPGGHPAVRKGERTEPWHMRLRAARAKAKLSRTGTVQKLKAKGIQITADAIKKHEEGVAMPRPDVRKAYALIYELTEDQLFPPGE